VTDAARLLYSSSVFHGSLGAVVAADAVAAAPVDVATAPVDVAIELRRRVARDALLDPFGWVGLAVVALVLHGMVADAAVDPGRTAAVAVAVLGVLATVSHRTADFLLFGMQENDFLRTQPLGPRGLLRVRAAELGWWSMPTRLLAAACGFGLAGAVGAGALFVAGTALDRAALRAAIALRDRFGAGAPRIGGAGAAAAVVALLAVPTGLALPPGASATTLVLGVAAAVGGLGLLGGRGVDAPFDARYARAASAASSVGRLALRRVWPVLDRLVPLPAPIRARWLRDVALLLRGWDGRGLFLLALSPLAGVVLAGELQGHLRPEALLWRVLQAAALGGAAVAYAVGPGVHVLRNRAMVWERTAPRPGRRATISAHAYAATFALLHAGTILATAALADGGRHGGAVLGVAPAVLALELAMAHYTVAYALTRTAGRRVAGETTLAFALPVVAVAVAGVSLVHPFLGLVYFAGTAGMYARGVDRYEAVEVTW